MAKICSDSLFGFAKHKGINAAFKPLVANDGLIACKQGEYRIAIREALRNDEAKAAYTLTHELAHYYLHRDKGNVINSPRHDEYEEQADRAAMFVMDLLAYQERKSAQG